MRRCSMAAICPLLLLIAAACAAETMPQRLQERLDVRVRKVASWRSDAALQVGFAVAVGLLGLGAGILQGWTEKKWAKAATAAVGLTVSGITLFTNSVYPADYHTLRRTIAKGDQVIEELRDILTEYQQAATSQDQQAMLADYVKECDKFDQLEQGLLGVGPSQSARLLELESVYAQSKPAHSAQPAWVSAGQQSDKSSTFFVGVGQGKSLTVAKGLSGDDAANKAADWLASLHSRSSQQQQQQTGSWELHKQFLDIVKASAEVDDTWFTYDAGKAVYRYYTRLRMNNEFLNIDLPTLSKSSNAVRVTVAGNLGWVDSGIQMSKGETVSLNASGEVRWGTLKSDVTGPSGSQKKLKPRMGKYPVVGMGAGGLIGKVGPAGTPFAVGDSRTITATASGHLYLGINDNEYQDNSGEFVVYVTKTGSSD